MARPGCSIDDVGKAVQSHAGECCALSDRIWDLAELSFEEAQSSRLQIELLQRHGFAIKRHLGGLPTAFCAEWGKGDPVIAFLGEYDALPNLPRQLATGAPAHAGAITNGHGCGHNLLGSGAMLAALAVRDLIREKTLPGTVRYYGCPAEEVGTGKAFMVRDGAFAGVDAAISWHPSDVTACLNTTTLANRSAFFRFHGQSAHACAAAPAGRSALDALELMSVGVNYLREHIPAEWRVHGAVTAAGGPFPNVIPSFTEAIYMLRAPSNAAVGELFQRVAQIAEGAALMTETKAEIEVDSACSGLLPNETLCRLMSTYLNAIGGPQFSKAEQQAARIIQRGFDRRDIARSLHSIFFPDDDRALSSRILPAKSTVTLVMASTDVGDVSWTVPVVQCTVACYAVGSQLHTQAVVQQSRSDAARRGMRHAAKIMSATALDLFMTPDTLRKARSEHAARGAHSYVSPLPAGLRPRPSRAGRQDSRYDDDVRYHGEHRSIVAPPSGCNCEPLVHESIPASQKLRPAREYRAYLDG
jgi:aminobenzoyl-glutamate utilization protein B